MSRTVAKKGSPNSIFKKGINKTENFKPNKQQTTGKLRTALEKNQAQTPYPKTSRILQSISRTTETDPVKFQETFYCLVKFEDGYFSSSRSRGHHAKSDKFLS